MDGVCLDDGHDIEMGVLVGCSFVMCTLRGFKASMRGMGAGYLNANNSSSLLIFLNPSLLSQICSVDFITLSKLSISRNLQSTQKRTKIILPTKQSEPDSSVMLKCLT